CSNVCVWRGARGGAIDSGLADHTPIGATASALRIFHLAFAASAHAAHHALPIFSRTRQDDLSASILGQLLASQRSANLSRCNGALFSRCRRGLCLADAVARRNVLEPGRSSRRCLIVW